MTWRQRSAILRRFWDGADRKKKTRKLTLTFEMETTACLMQVVPPWIQFITSSGWNDVLEITISGPQNQRCHVHRADICYPKPAAVSADKNAPSVHVHAFLPRRVSVTPPRPKVEGSLWRFRWWQMVWRQIRRGVRISALRPVVFLF